VGLGKDWKGESKYAMLDKHIKIEDAYVPPVNGGTKETMLK
jgi:hypothetical protein